MIGPESRAEFIDQRQPFVIRGHHIDQFSRLIKNRVSPANAAKDERLMYQEYIDRFSNIDPNLPGFNHDLAKEFLKYAHDIMGFSIEDADKVEGHMKQTFATFLALPNDYPAVIVEGIPDVICEGCAIGEHCNKLTPLKEPFNENIIAGDGINLDEFVRKFSLLISPNQLIIDVKEANFSDADPQQVRHVRTTIGAVKKVLEETDVSVWLEK